MKAELQSAKALCEHLSTEYNKAKSTKRFEKCDELINRLKLQLLNLNYLPTVQVSKQELLIARDFLEVACQVTIDKHDRDSFERYFSQLKTYYFDSAKELPESPFMFELIGCHLLCLLSQNRLASFHAQLELLSPHDLQHNVYIRHPVSIEQYLIEGSYNKIFVARNSVPSERCTFFIDLLVDTIREEIAECIEKSYERVSAKDGVRILFFDKIQQFTDYVATRNWTKVGDYYEFPDEIKADDTIESIKMSQEFLDYALQLEMII